MQSSLLLLRGGPRVQMLAYLLEKLWATPDGDGSLLDHSRVITYGSGMGKGNVRHHSDLPVLLAGKLGGRFKTGYHFDYKKDTPMANLLATILDKAGVPMEKLGSARSADAGSLDCCLRTTVA